MSENTLLNFVTHIVQDPSAAEMYRANPERAIADADLHGVTASDIDDLIPMVSETHGGGGLQQPDHGLWSGGDVVQSFDAFEVPGVPSESAQPDVATFDQLDSMQMPGEPSRYDQAPSELFDTAPDPTIPSSEPLSEDASTGDALTDGPLTDGPLADDVLQTNSEHYFEPPDASAADAPAMPADHNGFDAIPDWGSADDLDV